MLHQQRHRGLLVDHNASSNLRSLARRKILARWHVLLSTSQSGHFRTLAQAAGDDACERHLPHLPHEEMVLPLLQTVLI